MDELDGKYDWVSGFECFLDTVRGRLASNEMLKMVDIRCISSSTDSITDDLEW